MAVDSPTYGGPVAGTLRLIEEKAPLAANATSVTFSNLNGNVHKTYFWTYYATGNSSAGVITIKPNGLATNQRCSDLDVSSTSVTASAATVMRVGETTVAIGASGYGYLHAAANGIAGFYRTYQAHATRAQSAAVTIQKIYAGTWEEVATNITSLEFASSVASGLGIGSIFRLYYVG